MDPLRKFKPVNRHILIVPHPPKKKEESQVLLPEGYAEKKVEFVKATVVDISEDCNKQFRSLKYNNLGFENTVIVDKSMIQEIKIEDRTHFLILENYVLGILGRADEG